jgi:hypothetical protein
MQNRALLNHAFTLLIFIALAALAAGCQSPSLQVANNSAVANTSNSSNTSAPAASGYIDLVGKWEGQAGGQPSTLVISSHMGETFTGTKTTGEYQVDVAGVVDLKTREITIRETNLTKGKSGYPLGAGTGTIAPGGRQMSGEWKIKGSTSSFSFSK